MLLNTSNPTSIGLPGSVGGAANQLILIAVLVALVAPFLLYFDTARSIVAIWNKSDTYAHGYIILPISLWLIWRRRVNFAALPLDPYWPGLLLLGACGFGWLLARMGEVQVVMQYAFVAMIPVIALAVLGVRLTRTLTFPLMFLLLAVPFGEIFIDPLISFTADFTISALQLVGIPVLRNGTRFEIPSGSWSVVEACSGVRYLISSVTLGLLYAYLTYRSMKRRIIFTLFAIIVPIVANGLRAFMIVMIGHFSGMTLAVGVDHIIYGWAFFGLVMFLMFWIGGYWREDEDKTGEKIETQAAPAAVFGLHVTTTLPATVVRMAIAAVAVAAIWPTVAYFNDKLTYNPRPVALRAIQTTWASVQPFTTWTPRFAPADGAFSGVFQPAPGADADRVGLSILYYRNQRNGKAVISSTNRLVDDRDPLHLMSTSVHGETIGNRALSVRESVLDSATGRMLVWQWYVIDGQSTASNYAGKLLQAKTKLLFRGDDGAAILLSAPFAASPDEARKLMRAFAAANLPAIDAALAAVRAN
ncbi:MAG: exosortase A [Herminiimonas sp.]|nr:exosortase A [Herminiimonas sp.]